MCVIYIHICIHPFTCIYIHINALSLTLLFFIHVYVPVYAKEKGLLFSNIVTYEKTSLIMASIKNIKKFIKKFYANTGDEARIVHTGVTELTVYDVEHWPNELTTQLQRQYPTVQVDFLHSFASVSGFVVVIKHMNVYPQYFKYTAHLLLASVLMLILFTSISLM